MKRLQSILAMIVMLALASSCGGGTSSSHVPSGSTPVVSRLDPDSGTPGTQFSVYGFGFSYVPTENIVMVGESVDVASSYDIVDNPTSPEESEVLTVTVPDGAAPGASDVFVIVNGVASNEGITFTVTE